MKLHELFDWMNLDIPCTLRVRTHELLDYLLIVFYLLSNCRATYWPPCRLTGLNLNFFCRLLLLLFDHLWFFLQKSRQFS